MMPEPELVATPVAGIGDSRSERSLPIEGAPDIGWLLEIPDADRTADAGENVPADGDVMTALVRRRGARQGIGASAALSGERPAAETRIGFPEEAAASILNAQSRDRVPDVGVVAEPRHHDTGARLVVKTEKGPQDRLIIA